ncbi:MAG TPA: alanine-zipper protein [Burkholderiales bacterium]
MNRLSTITKVSLLALPLALAQGCGTSGGAGKAGAQTAAGPDRAEQALATAQSALNEARAARAAAEAANAKADQILTTVRAMPTSGGTSQEVLQASRAAQAAAEDAKRMAIEAQDAVERLDIKTDRMFEKSMRK